MSFDIIIFSVLLLLLLSILTWIDVKYLLLPNFINGILLVLGALQSIYLGRITLLDATLGGIFGAVLLGAVAMNFYWRRGYAGLGGGDVKFAGAAGFWVGWQGIPWLLLIASLSGLLFALIAICVHGRSYLNNRIPFGPFLCGSTFVVWTSFVLYE